MSYSKELSTTFANTKLRTPNNIYYVSGMCATCSNECNGMCEIGLSAVCIREKNKTQSLYLTSNYY